MGYKKHITHPIFLEERNIFNFVCGICNSNRMHQIQTIQTKQQQPNIGFLLQRFNIFLIPPSFGYSIIFLVDIVAAAVVL